MKKKNNKNILVRFSDEELKMLDEIYNYLNTEENIRITKSFIIRYGIATLYKKIKNNELEERNHKAIEYIEDEIDGAKGCIYRELPEETYIECWQEVLDILKGDKE